ncbi:hypothetical protein LXL04_017654 [Taraxacum kok-saghyz]
MWKIKTVSKPFMEDLPGDVMVDILSRLAVKTIIHCKCVCKKWLNLVSNSYFANLHLLRSPAGLMIRHRPEKITHLVTLKWVEMEDKLNHDRLHHNPVLSLNLNLSPIFQGTRTCLVGSRTRLVGSVDGLLCMSKYGNADTKAFICNPITREYIIFPRQSHQYSYICSYGFGVGAFLNGHGHWIIKDHEHLYAFDYDDETFKFLPSPPVETAEDSKFNRRTLTVVKDCLCQCAIFDSHLTIWVMKEYGIKKSWHKDVFIKRSSICPVLFSWTCDKMFLIAHFNDGTYLMFSDMGKLMSYCPHTETIVAIKKFRCCYHGVVYRPSFLKLQNFESERVHVF